jgi:hypothetical protein
MNPSKDGTLMKTGIPGIADMKKQIDAPIAQLIKDLEAYRADWIEPWSF